MDPTVRQGGDSGKPVVITNPESPVAMALCNVAESVAARISVAAVQQANIISVNQVG